MKLRPILGPVPNRIVITSLSQPKYPIKALNFQANHLFCSFWDTFILTFMEFLHFQASKADFSSLLEPNEAKWLAVTTFCISLSRKSNEIPKRLKKSHLHNLHPPLKDTSSKIFHCLFILIKILHV